MARVVIPLEASWYDVLGFGFRWRATPIGDRPQVTGPIAGGNERYVEDIVFRRDRTGIVLNLAENRTSAFAQSGNFRLSSDFETNGSITVQFNDGTADRELVVEMSGRDTDEPYIINFTGDEATAYTTFRGHFPTTDNSIAGTLILDDGAADTVAPTLESAETNTDGTEIVLTYDEALDEASVPATGDFSVELAAAAAAEAVPWGAATLNLEWHEIGTGGNAGSVSFAYDGSQAAGVPLFDSAGSTATRIRILCRGALTADDVAAAINGARVSGEQLVTATVVGSGTATRSFAVSADGFLAALRGGVDAVTKAVSGVAVAGEAVTLTVAAIAQDETITLDYTPGTNPIQDAAGNDAAALSDQAVTNNVVPADTTAPTFVSAETNAAGTQVRLLFSEALDSTITPQHTAFTLSPARTIRSATLSGPAQVTLTVAAAFAHDDTITVAYTKPSTNPLQDAAGNEVATFAAQSVTNRVPAGPPPLGRLLLDITIPVVFNTGAAGQWSGNGLVPASVLRDQDTAGNISVAVTETATDFLININVPRFTAALEDGVVGIELADGTRLATFTLDGTWSSGLTRYDIVAPDDGLTAAEVQAILGVGRASLVFKIGEGGIRLVGVGEAEFAAFPAATLDSTETQRVIGVGGAAFAAFPAATLTVTAPTPRRLAGIGEAQFTVPPAATLTLTGPTARRFSGIGEAAFNFPTATLSNTEAQKIVGVGEAAFAAFPAAELTRIVQPERFAGIGEAAFQAFAGAELTVTPPADVRFQGRGRARFQNPPAATLTRNVPRRFAGIGQAAFVFPAATLSVINPTARRFAGIGEAAFAAFPPATLTLTAPTARLFTGIGTAAFAAFPAAALSNNPARLFGGIGQAAFATFPAAALDVPTPIAPEDVDEYSARQARDLQGDEPRLALEITHPDIDDPIRIVADNRDHIIEGNNYIALAFRGSPPQIREGESPRAIFEIDNVGREMLQWVEATGGGRGAAARVLLVHADPVAGLSHIAWELPSVSVGTAEITNETIQMQLVFRSGRSRPGIKWKFDPVSSPGIY